MADTTYTNWDTCRRERYPAATHSEFESWYRNLRVAGYFNFDVWVFRTQKTLFESDKTHDESRLVSYFQE